MGGRYRPYEAYKPSFAKWSGDVPDHWMPIRLKHVFYEKKKKLNPELPAGSISFGNVIFKNEDSLAAETKASYQEVLAGEFLINPLNMNFDLKSLRTALSSINVVVSTGYMVLQSAEGYSKQYLRWLLQQFDVAHMKTLGAGVRQTIGFDDIGNSFIFKPTHEEQTQIAAFLDYETAKIDELIAKQERLIELLEEKRQAVISQAVMKGLNPSVELKVCKVDWIGEIPKHWKVKKLKYLISQLESGVSVNAANTPASKEEVAILKTSCVYTRSFRIEENKTVVAQDASRVKCPTRKGAIIISRMNTPELVGASAVVRNASENVFLPDRLWQTKFFDDNFQSADFLAYFMMIKGFRNQIALAAEGASSSMQNISKGDYLDISIALPSLAEQNEIVSFLSKRLERIDCVLAELAVALSCLKERRTALISAAVTGKIDVRDWQPPKTISPTNDNPSNGKAA